MESRLPAGSLTPYGLRQGHLGTNRKQHVSRGQENVKVSGLLDVKRPLPVHVYVCVGGRWVCACIKILQIMTHDSPTLKTHRHRQRGEVGELAGWRWSKKEVWALRQTRGEKSREKKKTRKQTMLKKRLKKNWIEEWEDLLLLVPGLLKKQVLQVLG